MRSCSPLSLGNLDPQLFKENTGTARILLDTNQEFQDFWSHLERWGGRITGVLLIGGTFLRHGSRGVHTGAGFGVTGNWAEPSSTAQAVPSALTQRVGRLQHRANDSHQALLVTVEKVTVHLLPRALRASHNYFSLVLSPKAHKAVHKMCAFFY